MPDDSTLENEIRVIHPPEENEGQLRLAIGTKLNTNQELVDVVVQFLFTEVNKVFDHVRGKNTICVYDSTTSPYLQQLANMFDIDIKDESEMVARVLLRYPIFTKAHLGTVGGMKKVLSPILSNMEVKTHDNKPDMPPYTFNVEATNNLGLDQKKIIGLINRFSCVRDGVGDLVLTAILCEKPFTIVTKLMTTKFKTYNIDTEACLYEQ